MTVYFHCNINRYTFCRNHSHIHNNFLYFALGPREKYYKHGLKAKQKPEKYISLIIDGMDQSKHNLPHLNVTTKVNYIYMAACLCGLIVFQILIYILFYHALTALPPSLRCVSLVSWEMHI